MTAAIYLHTYQCSLCQTVATSPISGRYDCRMCGRWMKHLFSNRAETAADKALAAQGLVFNPYKLEPQPWNCVRCGDEFRVMPLYRPDGKCCNACVKAEPVPALLTQEQIEARRAEKDALVREDEDRMEAAYRRAEQEMR